MKILYDARKIVPRITGVGHVSESLLRELLEYKDLEIIAFTRKGIKELPQLSKTNSNLLIHETNDSSEYFEIKRLLFEQWSLPKLINLYKPDILHLTNGFSVPLFLDKEKYHLKIVSTIHDLIPLTSYWELMSLWDRFLYKRLLSYSIKKSDAVVAVSGATSDDIKKYFSSIQQVYVINNGVDFMEKPDGFKEKWFALKMKHGIIKNYIFYLGGFAPRKNVFNLLNAYFLLKQQGKIDYQLILGGKLSTNSDIKNNLGRISSFIKKNRLEKDVKIVGYVSPKEKEILYINSAFFAYISLYEGFGLPVLEAISAGKPVLTSKNSVMEKIIGKYALYANPNNVEDIAEKIEMMIKEYSFYKNQAEIARREILPNFNWKKAGEQYYFIYKELVINK